MKCGKKSYGALDGKFVWPVMLPYKFSIKMKWNLTIVQPPVNLKLWLNYSKSFECCANFPYLPNIVEQVTL